MSAFPENRAIPVGLIGGVLIVLLVLTAGYSVVVMGSFLLWMVPWVVLFVIASLVFLVYLFYRLVVAVETIADEL